MRRLGHHCRLRRMGSKIFCDFSLAQRRRGTECFKIMIDDLLERCREQGLRKTAALVGVLETLIEAERPEAKRLKGSCDQATVFRLLQRLTDKGVLRRLGLHERAAYFTLIVPGRHQDYLICTSCGSIDSVNAPCPVHALEEEIREKTGFTGLYHELEFFGVCPKCA